MATKEGFVSDISNVKAFEAEISRLIEAPPDVPRMGLVHSSPGYGKTRTIARYVAQGNGIFVRAKALMTGRWLLQDIVEELGEVPESQTKKVFNQAAHLLLARQVPVFIDDVDHLCGDWRAIETLRDLHDTTGAPIILVGMETAERKLRAHKHIYDRLSTILRFGPLSLTDVKTIIKQKYELAFDDGGIKALHESPFVDGKYRKLVVLMMDVQYAVSVNGLKKVTADTINECALARERRVNRPKALAG